MVYTDTTGKAPGYQKGPTMSKKRKIESRSTVGLGMILRGGAGKHDARPNRQRTRQTAMRAALRDA